MADPANPNAQPTTTPSNKTLAATGGSAVGAAVATIALFLIDPKGTKLPPTVSGSVTVLTTAFVTFIAGYFTPPGAGEGIVKSASGQAVSAR